MPCDYTDGKRQHLFVSVIGLSYIIVLNGQTLSTQGIPDAEVADGTLFGMYADDTSSAAFEDLFLTSPSLVGSTYTIGDGLLELGGSYGWLVQSYDGFGMGSWSATSTFASGAAPSARIP